MRRPPASVPRPDGRRSSVRGHWRSSGRSVRQRSTANGQRGWKAHPGGGLAGSATSPLGSDDGIAPLPDRPSAPRPAAPRCRDGAAADTASSVGATSTMRPTYITATRSLTCRTTLEVVRDEQHRQAEPVLQVEQQVDDLRLHRHVERGHRLVGDDQARVERQRAGDADALALAAAERVREAVACDRAAGRPGPAARHPRLAAPAARDAVDQQRFGDDVAAPSCADSATHTGSWKIICMCRRSGRSARRDKRREVDRRAVLRREPDFARGRRQRAQDAAGDGGLAAAALAHQRQRLAARDVESSRHRRRAPGPTSRRSSPLRIGKCFAGRSTSRTFMRRHPGAGSRQRAVAAGRHRRRRLRRRSGRR